jgi:hypothetical protein
MQLADRADRADEDIGDPRFRLLPSRELRGYLSGYTSNWMLP